jgi:type I restriction enzyme, R subunit
VETPLLSVYFFMEQNHFRGGVYRAYLTNIARGMRKNETSSEQILWCHLKNRKLKGLKFRRQHQIGPFIVDFYCHKDKLIIELDGSVHQNKKQIEYDCRREDYLRLEGFQILRITNCQLKDKPSKTIQYILEMCQK